MDIDPEVAPGLEPAPEDRLKDLKRQTDEVIETLEQNMKRLVKREENLEGLENVSKELEEESKVFKQTAKKVRRSYWWKNAKLGVVIVVVVLVIILVIILIIVLLAKGVIPKP